MQKLAGLVEEELKNWKTKNKTRTRTKLQTQVGRNTDNRTKQSHRFDVIYIEGLISM